MKLSPPLHQVAALILGLSFTGVLRADIDNLWITEVVPSTGQIELTNIGDTSIAQEDFSGVFCYTRIYSAPDFPDTLGSGESVVFTINRLNAADSDLFLYRNRQYTNPDSVISGLKWGPAANVGRTSVASTAGKWTGADQFVQAPEDGQALQLTGPDPFSPENWSVGEPDLGNFQPVTPLITDITFNGESGAISLDWSGGTPPYQVQMSTDLQVWEDRGFPISNTSLTIPIDPLGGRFFLRVATGIQPAATSTYRVTFTSLWSRNTFNTVPGGDHFSGLIGATHNDSVVFWQPGMLATPGIQRMAETGGKSLFRPELQAAIDAGTAQNLLDGGGADVAGTSVTLDFTVNASHPLVTLTSMIAPSPDWFVGTHGLSLLDENGAWISLLDLDLLPYDAGTDDGTTFTSPNDESDPHQPISRFPDNEPSFAPIMDLPLPLPIASFSFERIQ